MTYRVLESKIHCQDLSEIIRMDGLYPEGKDLDLGCADHVFGRRRRVATQMRDRHVEPCPPPRNVPGMQRNRRHYDELGRFFPRLFLSGQGNNFAR